MGPDHTKKPCPFAPFRGWGHDRAPRATAGPAFARCRRRRRNGPRFGAFYLPNGMSMRPGPRRLRLAFTFPDHGAATPFGTPVRP